MRAGYLLAGLLLFCGAALGASWEMDGDASSLDFFASYQREPVPGTFRDFATILAFDPGRPEEGRLHVVVDITSMDLSSGDLEEGAASEEWFDVRRFPKAEFFSDNIRETAPGEYEASGRLTLKGVSKRVVVPFTFEPTPEGARMRGELDLLRSEFAIGTGPWASGRQIGLDVTVKFDVALRRGH